MKRIWTVVAAATTLSFTAPAYSEEVPVIDITNGLLMADDSLSVLCADSKYPTIIGIFIDRVQKDKDRQDDIFAAKIDWKGQLIQVAHGLTTPAQIIPGRIGDDHKLTPVSKGQQERFDKASPLLFRLAEDFCHAAEESSSPPSPQNPEPPQAPLPKAAPLPDTSPSLDGPHTIPANLNGRRSTVTRTPA